MIARRLIAAVGTLLCVGLVAGCGGSASSLNCTGPTMKMSNGEVMCKSAMSSETGVKADKSAPQVSTKVPEVNGVKPIAMQVLAHSYWQGMDVQAEETTPVRFLVYNGTKERMIYPSKGASFHLMIMLSDRHTGEPIPYATVWITISTMSGKRVFDARQWPMISAFMGPHYGNDVALPKAGRYKLSVLISPPVSARGLEYRHVWLHQHRVIEYFNWGGKGHGTAASSSAQSAGGMDMSGGSMSMSGTQSGSRSQTVNGQKAVSSKPLATSYWQGMKIQTRESKPVKFTIFDGTSQKLEAPTAKTSLNLRVLLSDKYTGEPIPYSAVKAVIRNSTGKVVYQGNEWPMISAFTGPMYSNNVSLPGRGRYTLTLSIEPPVAARHLEYRNVWLHEHTVVEHFTYSGAV